ncbi:MAG: hypothetical protein WKF96_11880 [Solirubrobacteraceae bacterium]
MRYRPIEGEPDDPRLGRFLPDDWGHIDKYPLMAAAIPAAPTPVVIGVNWYAEFFKPERDESTGEYWLAPGGSKTLTRVKGGHCVCLEPGDGPDPDEWWQFYDQGREGACVGFGWSRCMSLLNNELYAARWLWDRAKELDQWPETNPGDENGTSVRAAAEILSKAGHVDWQDGYADDNDHTVRGDYQPERVNGLKTFRWAQSVDDVHATLSNDRADALGAVPVLNSWGQGYPHRTWMPDEVLKRLMEEDGEIAVPTDA